MSDHETVEFLRSIALLQGHSDVERAELGRLLRRRDLQAGATLWRQGEPARELALVVDGDLGVSLHVPGDRVLEIGTAHRGDVVGEIGLLDGGEHTMTVSATASATVLVLTRRDFAALLARRDPGAYRLKRRLASQLTARLRNQLTHVAATLGEPSPDADGDVDGPNVRDLEFRGPPDGDYLRRMAVFREFDPVALWGFLTSGKYASCTSGETLVTEGRPSSACYLTINGAVEKVLIRGDRRVRVELAGPGKAFGYEGLIDDGPSPVTAITRERALLLVLPKEPFRQLFEREDTISDVFLDVILRDLATTVRETLRPHARLASSV